MKVSEALKQVWQWKQAVYEDTRGMDSSQRLAYYRQASRRLQEKTSGRIEFPAVRRGRRKPR